MGKAHTQIIHETLNEIQKGKNMLHFILSEPNLFFLSVMVISIITGVFLVTALSIDCKRRLASTIAWVLTFLVPTILIAGIAHLESNTTKNMKYSGDWKEVYQNELDANVKIHIDDNYMITEGITLTAGQPLNIEQKKLHRQILGTLSITKDNATVKRNIIIMDKDTFIAKGKVNPHSKIIKVEYRPIEGYTKSAYGETGDFIKLKDYGEVRITLEDVNTEDKLQKLLD